MGAEKKCNYLPVKVGDNILTVIAVNGELLTVQDDKMRTHLIDMWEYMKLLDMGKK